MLKTGFAANDQPMKKSTAIVTWTTYRNFGTSLQAYALQQTVKSLGYSNVIIDDASVIASFPRKRFSPVRMLRNIPWLYPRRAEFRKKNRGAELEYDMFRQRYMDIDSNWSSREELSCRYDVYIAGSDQIWSPAVRFDGFYFLDFTDRQKISYAPSLGTSDYPLERVRLVKPLIERFSALSVRETQGARIIKDKFALDAEVVADPTILLTREDWESIIPEQGTKGKPYLLCYLLTYNKLYIDFVRRYCETHGLVFKLLVVSPDLEGISEDGIYTGPLGFLEALRGADAVMTDSFHGTIFSILFGKDFHTFRRFRDDDSSGQNSRLENLLGGMGLMDRYLSEESLKLSDIPLDYGRVDDVVSDMREASIRYLRESLEKSCGEERMAYAAYASTSQDRMNAASGGAASMLARAFIRDGGVVYGCAQKPGVQISHMRIDDVDDIWRLAGSKYVHSQAVHVFNQIKRDLEQSRKVLFIGLPCQVAAVRKTFDGSGELLYTIDLCCHGTPSQSILIQHMEHLGLASVADRVIFRSKESSGIRYGFKVFDDYGRCLYDKPARKDWYMTGFLSSLFFRKCCFSCPYACPERCSDLTLADHWAMGESSDPEMTLSKGISTILINTGKGRRLFDSASQYLVYERRPISEALMSQEKWL